MKASTASLLFLFSIGCLSSSAYAQNKNACDLVTKADVESILGTSVQPPMPSDPGRLALLSGLYDPAPGLRLGCSYTNFVGGQPRPANLVNLSVEVSYATTARPNAVDRVLKNVDAFTYQDGRPIPDLGDAALWITDAGPLGARILVVFSGGKTALLVGGAGNFLTLDQAKALATKALGDNAKTGFVYGVPLPFTKPVLGTRPAKPSQIDQLKFDLTAKAETGNAKAQFALGNFYEFGMIGPDGIPKPDYPAAAYWYQEASNRGEAPASFALALLLRDGQGMARNPTAALELFRKAAVAGYVPAMVPLSYAYGEQNDSEQTRTDLSGWRAQRWAVAAAEANDPAGHLIVGYLYHQGLNLPPGAAKSAGYKDAMASYQKAAAGGDCVALMNIGGMYFNGDGVPQDKNQAQSWFAKAEACNGGNLDWMRDKAARYRERAAAGRLPAVQAAPAPPGNAGLGEVEKFAKGVLAMLATSLASDALNSNAASAVSDVNYSDLLRQLQAIRQSACLRAGLAFASDCR
jgi:TPR repeat protein